MLLLDTSIAFTGAKYPMKVIIEPSVERLRASSDLDEKLVTIWSLVGGTPFWVLFGTSTELMTDPDGVI